MHASSSHSPMGDPITVFEQLPANKDRPRNLVESFEKTYGNKPAYVARAPGRVSIIGEHIDYAGLSVLPAAIDRDVIMACSISSPSSSDSSTSRIRIANVSSRFPAEELSYSAGSEGPPLDPKAHSWVNYFKAGLKGVLGQLSAEAKRKAVHLDIMVDGNVPPGGGLSSSAAMVVSSAIATLQAYDAIGATTQGQLAEIAISSERLVGVNSGGMDQSASIFSREGHVLNVGFDPLEATLVPMPADIGVSFVIANSLVVSEKQVTAKFNYNRRVVELRVVGRVLAKHLNLRMDTELPTLKNVMDGYFGKQRRQGADLLAERQDQLQTMLDIVEEVLGNAKEGDSWEQVYTRLGGMSEQDFKNTFHPDFDIEANELQLYKRAKHAFSEARRVYQYRGLLESGGGGEDGLAEKLGDLMNDSQSSCRDLYDCSCAELDELCDIARRAGSLGSRLSGAGWGGCSVHIVPDELRDHLIDTLKKEYYAKKFPDLTAEQLEEAVFATKPEEGACLYTL